MPVRPVPPPPGPEGRPLSYSPTPIGSNDSQLSCMTISSDSVTGREGASSSLWEQRKEEIAAAGLSGFGDSPTAVWVGNIPESSSSEEAIRELFERFGGIRRVFLRRKAPPSPSWCLITFRSSDAAGEALGATVAVPQADGSSVELFIEPPMVEQHLSKANPGALGSVVETALDDEEQEEPVDESEAARGQGSPGAGGEAWVVIKASIPREELLAFLHRNPVFSASSGVNPDEKNAFVERIAGRLERRFYSSSSMIVTKGSEATEMFFIYTGLAEVYMDHPDAVSKIPPVARLKVGTFFGEGALLSEGEQPRNSWIRATCDMEVYALCAGELKAALGAHPSVRKLFNTEKEKRDLKNTRSRWAVMKSSRFRNKLSTLSVFVHNDDDNEKAAKAAIKEVLRKVRVEEIDVTSTLKGLVQLHRGEMRGLDFRFKNSASLFRKVMARLDRAIGEAQLKGASVLPTPESILDSINDILRYTVVVSRPLARAHRLSALPSESASAARCSSRPSTTPPEPRPSCSISRHRASKRCVSRISGVQATDIKASTPCSSHAPASGSSFNFTRQSRSA